MAWALGNVPDDPRALSISAFSDSMAPQHCAKSLASQLTSPTTSERESGAFQG